MRERDMRQRVEQFIQTRLRKMVAPATIGLGLAMTGCPSSGLDATDDGGAMVNKDAGPDQGATTKYMAQLPDAQQGVPIYSAPAPTPDAAPPVRYGAQMRDAGPDTGRVIALYMAQLPIGRS